MNNLHWSDFKLKEILYHLSFSWELAIAAHPENASITAIFVAYVYVSNNEALQMAFYTNFIKFRFALKGKQGNNMCRSD